LLLAAVAFGAFVALGFSVVRSGEPAALAAWEHAIVNHSTLLAWWLTWSCYVYVLGPLVVALLVVAWRVPSWRARILFSLAMLIVCWQAADLFQHVFARPRRLDWVVRHEHAFSYPSSHAAISTGFYGLWAAIIYASELPAGVRVSAGSLLALLAVGICWSRLALGAHYLTDLVGGALLGLALVAAAVAAVPVKVFAASAGRS